MKKMFLFLCALAICNSDIISQTIVRKIKPSDTDSLIATFNIDSNYIYINTQANSQKILVVHLPGSFGEPKRSTLFGTLASDLGFHSIGLMYPNAPTVGSFCTNSQEVNCFEDVRREIVEGIDYSNEIAISKNESILSRTKMLLLYLNTKYPSENWGQYLDSNNNLEYSKIIFSGHSQGGGHAALIAKYFPIKRAICFSSPKDWRNQSDAPPLWLSSGDWKTKRSEIYSFNHVLDEHTNHQLEIWDSLGLNKFGNPINVDDFLPPYNNTRQLTTSYNVPSGDDHACTIQDNKTPKLSGLPVFIPVWTYMLTHNLVTHVSTDFDEENTNILITSHISDGITNINFSKDNYSLNVFDQYGKLVFTQTASRNTQLNLSELAIGVYYIQVIFEGKTIIRKILKY